MTTVQSAPVTNNGLTVLDADQLRLLRGIERVFLSWAEQVQAPEFRYPFLMQCADLDRFDYYDNFPHLGLAATRLDPQRLAAHLAGTERPVATMPAEVMETTMVALPSAACYNIYLHLRGAQLPAEGVRRTTVATCFRNEDHYNGLQRLLGFSMREIVFVGGEDGAKAHLEAFKERVLELTGTLGLEVNLEVATDPFFDKNSGKAKMQRLFPVKQEFVVDGLAIGSVNYHRNFFGERCEISVASDANATVGDDVAHTSCAAFGLERWIHTLTNRFGSAAAAADALEEI